MDGPVRELSVRPLSTGDLTIEVETTETETGDVSLHQLRARIADPDELQVDCFYQGQYCGDVVADIPPLSIDGVAPRLNFAFQSFTGGEPLYEEVQVECDRSPGWMWSDTSGGSNETVRTSSTCLETIADSSERMIFQPNGEEEVCLRAQVGAVSVVRCVELHYR